MKLKDKIAIITGAASGIGLSCAKLFSEQGAIVIMADIDREKNICEAKKINAIPMFCDVRSTTDVQHLIRGVMERYAKIDILINNAAVAIGGDITEMPESDWVEVINTNLTSAYRTIREVLPCMISQKGGQHHQHEFDAGLQELAQLDRLCHGQRRAYSNEHAASGSVCRS